MRVGIKVCALFNKISWILVLQMKRKNLHLQLIDLRILYGNEMYQVITSKKCQRSLTPSEIYIFMTFKSLCPVFNAFEL